MRRTQWLQETRLMRFEEAYEGWTQSRFTQGVVQVRRWDGLYGVMLPDMPGGC